jgi:hypothetical protein
MVAFINLDNGTMIVQTRIILIKCSGMAGVLRYESGIQTGLVLGFGRQFGGVCICTACASGGTRPRGNAAASSHGGETAA